MQQSISGYYEEAADRTGVAAQGRGLRLARAAFRALAFAGAALAMNPSDSEGRHLSNALFNISSQLQRGRDPDESDVLSAAIAVQNIYGSDIAALITWGELNKLSECAK
jgi:hypothetical protein